MNAPCFFGPVNATGDQVDLPAAHARYGTGAVQQHLALVQRAHNLFLRANGFTPLQRAGHGHSQRFQNLALAGVQLTRLSVYHAQCADVGAVAQHHGCTSIKARVGHRGDQRIVAKARVARGIGHFQHVIA